MLKNTIFEGTKTPLHLFVHFIWLWILEEEHGKTITQTGAAPVTIGAWNKLLLQAIDRHYQKNPAEQIGGPGVIVEIDESKFGKQKYHVSDCENDQQNIEQRLSLTFFTYKRKSFSEVTLLMDAGYLAG